MTQPTFELDRAVLTDEKIERARQRTGIPMPRANPPHNYEVTWDAVRHFAYGYGDDNPLYCDPDYGKRTRWGGLIAPPTFLYTMGENAAPPLTPEQKELMRGDPFAGLGSYQAMMEFEWWRPLTLGDRLYAYRTQVGVQVKKSEFGGRTAHVTIDFIYKNQRDELVAIQRGTWINAERQATRERGERRPQQIQSEPYTAAQLAAIDAAYEAETRRGAEPRYWEDVVVGEELPPKVKGPLKTTNIIIWHVGWGMQLTPPGNFRLEYLVRKKAPGLYPPNPLNIPDTVQRLHWEPERAKELGIPTAYDYGAMRETWLCHLITDWMGDDGWLWKLSCQHRRFNYMGDTTWVKGRVTDKKQQDGRHEVYLDVWCENQRGEITSPGQAVVLLPTRDQPVTLPQPPVPTMEEMIKYEMERLA